MPCVTCNMQPVPCVCLDLCCAVLVREVAALEALARALSARVAHLERMRRVTALLLAGGLPQQVSAWSAAEAHDGMAARCHDGMTAWGCNQLFHPVHALAAQLVACNHGSAATLHADPPDKRMNGASCKGKAAAACPLWQRTPYLQHAQHVWRV